MDVVTTEKQSPRLETTGDERLDALCRMAWDLCRMNPAMSVVDYGAGSGFAANWFASHGMLAMAVDEDPNTFDARYQSNVSFACCKIHDGYFIPATHFAFCSDVLNHMEPHEAELSLEAIAHRTADRSFFFLPDSNFQEWNDRLSKYFSVIAAEHRGNDCYFVASRKG